MRTMSGHGSHDQRQAGRSSRPISGASVVILDGPDCSHQATTDSSGRYAFEALQQAGFSLRASANGYTSATRIVTLTGITAVQIVQLPKPDAAAEMVVVVRVAPGAAERAFGGHLDRHHGRRAGEDSAPSSEEAAGVHVFRRGFGRSPRASTVTTLRDSSVSGHHAKGPILRRARRWRDGEQNGRQHRRRRTATNQYPGTWRDSIGR
jgi:hypothetical protein